MMKRTKHLYIHVPFCKAICFYCDFCHIIYNNDTVIKWLYQLSKQIKDECNDQYKTIYIGGGTPSCLSNEELDGLLSLIDPYTNEVEEYTIEANPESLTEDKIDIIKRHHVNRVSLGVQTTDETLLKTINRHHSFDDVKNVIQMLNDKSLCNISVDLMYSLPGQTMDMLNRTIDDILSLDVPHISIYSLTVEENSVFGKKGIDKLDDDTEASMYELIIERLTDAGYINYEVSNFCKPDMYSRHNMAYWNYEDFLGLSAGAAGKLSNRRYQITGDVKRYIEDYKTYDEDILLEKEDLMFENIMMSLRTIYGLDIKMFNKLYDCDFCKIYSKGISNPLIRIENDICYCTNKALLNSVLMDFMD